ncbi:phosphotransferase [Oceanimonas sp. MB9]|uniref:protein kinase domain-containing protein n=1 Tax=Oceanimonas sp. MB9 TaxID=2588453 RepID=UPI0013F65D43|nr:phosphotransferase [Oceanimonas sp. MB9]NHI01280.1 Serine/threonine-protein kinase PrkC [Oceanimonas sp. MB9]
MDALGNFYIPEEQSIYLLSANDAQKLKDWIALCIAELEKLGYRDITLAGKGVYGFTFAGTGERGEQVAFKFSRLDLPEAVRERLADEAYMLSCVRHPLIPEYLAYALRGRQGILLMSRAPGEDLEHYSLRRGRLSAREVIDIAAQLADILQALRRQTRDGEPAPVVHGDIKPSNIMYDPGSGRISLVDWGSSVFAQQDADGHWAGAGGLALLSGDLQQSNARMGDVYFIGPEQLAGALSSPRFDEQGVAGTLYALASGQGCRFGRKAMPAASLGLPLEFARLLDALLDDDPERRRRAGDYWLAAMPRLKQLVLPELPLFDDKPQLPVWPGSGTRDIDTVVYSSRKSFLREHSEREDIQQVADAQLERYYKQYLEGMGETEKAFVAAVGRLGRYPVMGGLAIHWHDGGVDIDSSLNLYDKALLPAFGVAVNNVVALARAITKNGVFKACLFNARNTLHLSRSGPAQPFMPAPAMRIPYRLADSPDTGADRQPHSYFEDGRDPDEQLVLPEEIMVVIARLNHIHHSGCIIFEVTSDHLKLHSYYRLLDVAAEAEFAALLAQIVAHIPLITDTGVGGFMKLPCKNTRFFSRQPVQPERFYPANPRAWSRTNASSSG